MFYRKIEICTMYVGVNDMQATHMAVKNMATLMPNNSLSKVSRQDGLQRMIHLSQRVWAVPSTSTKV